MMKTSSISQWRNYANNYRLQATKCCACDKTYFPKKHLCVCGSQKFILINLSGNGKLLTFTQVNNATALFTGATPYCLGIVELDEGIKILAQLADVQLSNLKIGMGVTSVFRKLYDNGVDGAIGYGVKFVPEKSSVLRTNG